MPQEPMTFTRDYVQSVRLEYLRYLPAAYGTEPGKKWPLILFLHGAGERGTDIEQVKVHGIPKIAERMDLPFVCLSPQCPPNHWWSDFIPALEDLVTTTAAALDVDPKRVYLTGLSMGGYGTWHLASTCPNRFAAIAPICGGGAWFYGFPEAVRALKDTPTWVFHGAKDSVVNLSESQELVDALKACGGNVEFTVYPEADHDSWTETYNNPALYEWFLAHSLK